MPIRPTMSTHARSASIALLSFTVVGALVAGIALSSANTTLASPLLGVVVLVAALAGSFVQLTFMVGREPVPLSLDGPAIMLGAVFLPPHVAAGIAAVVMLLDIPGLRSGREGWKLLINTAVSGLGALAAGAVAWAAVSNAPGPELVLVIALCVVAVDDLLQVVLYTALFELKESGAGRAFARSCRTVLVFDVIVSSVTVVVVSPFVDRPLLMAAILGTLMFLVAAMAKVSTNENLHRMKNEYLRDVFGRYVPSHVAESLAESGEEIRLGGEQREVTVLFCDIRGFTSWSETVEAEEVITQLNVLLRGLSAAVMATEGTLDKYTGDGLMAFWGAPLEQPDHAERAMTAAIDMLVRLDECNKDRAAAGLEPFAIGVGVHSGSAVVGNIGHEDRLDYTAIGDTVNTSARLEAATKDVGSALVLSEATFDRLPSERQRLCREVGGIRVKGKAEPIEVYATELDAPSELMRRWREARAPSPADLPPRAPTPGLAS